MHLCRNSQYNYKDDQYKFKNEFEINQLQCINIKVYLEQFQRGESQGSQKTFSQQLQLFYLILSHKEIQLEQAHFRINKIY